MSSATFDQLREEVLRLPPQTRRTLKSMLQLENEERQRLLDELTEQKPIQHPEVKVRRGVARDFSCETAWLRENAHLYPKQHLAVSGDQLLAHGSSFGEVFDKAQATGQDFLMHYSVGEDEPWSSVNFL